MKKFKNIGQMAKALQDGEIPADVVSPGAAAAALGITRQAVRDRMIHDTLESWTADGVVLISMRSLKAAVKKKKGVPDSQGELNV